MFGLSVVLHKPVCPVTAIIILGLKKCGFFFFFFFLRRWDAGKLGGLELSWRLAWNENKMDAGTVVWRLYCRFHFNERSCPD